MEGGMKVLDGTIYKTVDTKNYCSKLPGGSFKFPLKRSVINHALIVILFLRSHFHIPGDHMHGLVKTTVVSSTTRSRTQSSTQLNWLSSDWYMAFALDDFICDCKLFHSCPLIINARKFQHNLTALMPSQEIVIVLFRWPHNCCVLAIEHISKIVSVNTVIRKRDRDRFNGVLVTWYIDLHTDRTGQLFK